MSTQSNPNLPGAALPSWRGFGFVTFVLCIVLAAAVMWRQDEPGLSGTVGDGQTFAP